MLHKTRTPRQIIVYVRLSFCKLYSNSLTGEGGEDKPKFILEKIEVEKNGILVSSKLPSEKDMLQLFKIDSDRK